MTTTRRPIERLVATFVAGWLAFACDAGPTDPGDAATTESEVRYAPPPPRPTLVCPDASETRNAYYGDLHVHTALSSDAWMFDVRTTPDDAYRYAFGGEAWLPPLDEAGRPTRRVANPRPLDFMAVTDHAEFLGELSICTDPEAPGTASALCQAMRSGVGRAPELVKQIFSPFPGRDEATCGDDLAECLERSGRVWGEVQASAARWNVPCRQTTFVGYEYSSHRLGSNLHRNVIFRGAAVPARPISYLEANREVALWEALERECLEAGTGCDVLAIPHNSNISNGRMFAVDYPGAWTRTAKAGQAALRARLEPLVEIMQHKGDSECRNGLPGVQGGIDELCDFEKFEDPAFENVRGTRDVPDCYEGPGAGWWLHRGPDCLSPRSYARYALIEGLRQEAELGVNPFKFGLIASTDTHNGTGGAVDEADYAGHLGIGDANAAERVAPDPAAAGNVANNPGGLVGVLARQNGRDAIFDALERREVFGTSGPRMEVRFYGGWAMPDGVCTSAERLAMGDAHGVPMGGDLPTRGEAQAPRFLAIGRADPGTAEQPGMPLERLQVVKGWVGDDGDLHQRVYDVAGGPGSAEGVDPATCSLSRAASAAGARELCRVWQDPDFDPTTRALYYVRVVEAPSCRYSRLECLALDSAERPAACDDVSIPRTIQERAWSSPIWYTP
ncbi:MAG TPA: DUF3604 domain-containing protein [Myxococcota bacterium]|nr:DUF3604 domain-containing protein [Myxococcota bacterium]